jgi:hypothetical protein
MLKPQQQFKISINELMNPHSRKHYESIGFDYQQLKTTYKSLEERQNNFVYLNETQIKINHSTILIYICDYCQAEFESNGGRRINHQSPEGLDRCKVCAKKQGFEKLKKTIVERYGVENYSQTKEYRKQCSESWKNKTQEELLEIDMKRQNTNLLLYGVTHSAQRPEVRAKTVATNLERYGVEVPAQNADILQQMKDTCLERHGTENISQTQKWKDQVSFTWDNKTEEDIAKITNQSKQTMLERYGVEHPMQSESMKEKHVKTCEERYGVSNVSQCKEIRDTVKATNLERYGNEEFLASDYSIQKRTQTLLDTYGVDHPMKVPEIADVATKNALRSKYHNGTGPSSKQQRYICKVYTGELNYYLEDSHFILDIAFPEQKICIEYDGSGHNLDVICGNITLEEKAVRERKRNYFLLNRQWKIMRIISTKDLIPSDEVLLKMKDMAFDWFSTHTWINFDIDNSTVITSNGTHKFDYQPLRKTI